MHHAMAQYTPKAGLCRYKEQGGKVVADKMKNLHKTLAFKTVKKKFLTTEQQVNDLRALIFLK